MEINLKLGLFRGISIIQSPDMDPYNGCGYHKGCINPQGNTYILAGKYHFNNLQLHIFKHPQRIA
ncbi:hypothetical protein DSM1535_2053 [Methanobacterium formicicum]|uniref:Uncharacterized protein n=1 Tax=Methanobacterium formicicum TaxID=2162 RepID=A0A090JXU3_METFO|nr:hypothetical protein DSM1535_2053 [Methanobacterium formicicum]